MLFSRSWENNNWGKFREFSFPWNSRNSVGTIHLFRRFRLPELFICRKFPTLVSRYGTEQSFAPVSMSLHQCTPYTAGNNCKNSIRHFSKVAGYRKLSKLGKWMRKGFQTLSMVCLIAKTDIKAKLAIDTAHVHCFNLFTTGALRVQRMWPFGKSDENPETSMDAKLNPKTHWCAWLQSLWKCANMTKTISQIFNVCMQDLSPIFKSGKTFYHENKAEWTSAAEAKKFLSAPAPWSRKAKLRLQLRIGL